MENESDMNIYPYLEDKSQKVMFKITVIFNRSNGEAVPNIALPTDGVNKLLKTWVVWTM